METGRERSDSFVMPLALVCAGFPPPFKPGALRFLCVLFSSRTWDFAGRGLAARCAWWQSRGDASLTHEVAVGLSVPGSRPGHRRGVRHEVPSARAGSWCLPGVPCVCMWWDTLYLHTLLSNKELLDQISESQREFGCGLLVRAALVTVGAHDPSLDF